MKQYDDRDGAIPVWVAGAREGIAEFPMRVIDVGLERGGFRVHTVALYEGARVGFSWILAPTGEKAAGANPLGLSLQPARVEWVTLGDETDHALRAFAASLGVPLKEGAKARARIEFKGVVLTGDVRRLASSHARVKLFYERPTEDEAFEMLVNIDLPERRVVLTEKWVGYRRAVVRALTYVPARDAN
jgi:hypothetical protein